VQLLPKKVLELRKCEQNDESSPQKEQILCRLWKITEVFCLGSQEKFVILETCVPNWLKIDLCNHWTQNLNLWKFHHDHRIGSASFGPPKFWTKKWKLKYTRNPPNRDRLRLFISYQISPHRGFLIHTEYQMFPLFFGIR